MIDYVDWITGPEEKARIKMKRKLNYKKVKRPKYPNWRCMLIFCVFYFFLLNRVTQSLYISKSIYTNAHMLEFIWSVFGIYFLMEFWIENSLLLLHPFSILHMSLMYVTFQTLNVVCACVPRNVLRVLGIPHYRAMHLYSIDTFGLSGIQQTKDSSLSISASRLPIHGKWVGFPPKIFRLNFLLFTVLLWFTLSHSYTRIHMHVVDAHASSYMYSAWIWYVL